MSDFELISKIQDGGPSREEAWKFILTIWNSKIFGNIISKGATEDEMNEVFCTIYEKVEERICNKSKERIENLAAFLSSCIRYEWYRYKNKEKNIEDLNNLINWGYNPEIEDKLKLQDDQKLLKMLIEKLDKKCKQILELWSFDYSLIEIANELNLRDSVVVKKQKYNCLEKLRSFVKSNNLNWNG